MPDLAGYTPSAHVKAITDSFLGTEFENYASDMLVNQPDYVVFTPKQNNLVTGDIYNDHFQVFDKPDGRLFAVWTQATVEGDVDQHIAFSNPDVYPVKTDLVACRRTVQILACVGSQHTRETGGAHIAAFYKQRFQVLHLAIGKGMQPMFLMIILKLFEAAAATNTTGTIPV